MHAGVGKAIMTLNRLSLHFELPIFLTELVKNASLLVSFREI